MGRAGEASDARTRLLETAWRLIGERQDAAIPLLEIARAAGVSRQTVYDCFGNRAGLLLAMVEHRDATSRELAAVRRTRLEQPTDGLLEPLVRNWFRYLPVIFPVAHALQAAAARDADARAAWESRMQLLRNGLLAAMRRLHADRRLAPGWTPEAASDWCYHLVHIDTWQHLVVELGWRPAEVVRRTVATLRAVLIERRADA